MLVKETGPRCCVVFEQRKIADENTLEQCETIFDVKNAVEAKTKILASCQVLTYKSFLLTDDMALDDLKSFVIQAETGAKNHDQQDNLEGGQ